jgi:DNA modification methylase
MYVKKYVREHNLKCPARDVIECMTARVLAMLPGPKIKAASRIYEDDSRRMEFNSKGDWSGQADLIITSPPYLARQTYVKDSWLRLWLLNRDPRAVRAKSLETGNILKFIEMMERCLHESMRLLTGGRCFLVCGTSRCDISNAGRRYLLVVW